VIREDGGRDEEQGEETAGEERTGVTGQDAAGEKQHYKAGLQGETEWNLGGDQDQQGTGGGGGQRLRRIGGSDGPGEGYENGPDCGESSAEA
jgi:hypothetical protein